MTKTILIFGIVMTVVTAASGQDSGAADTVADTVSVATADTTTSAVTDTDAIVDSARTAATGTPTLSIATDPAGADVTVNGKNYGASPVTITDLAPGRHSLELSLPGHFRRRATIDLDSADTDLSFELSRPATVNITSAPVGAAVTVDGEAVGTTPVKMDKQRPGEYNITVAAEGFAQVDTTINVASGGNDTVHIALTPKPAEVVRQDPDTSATTTVTAARDIDKEKDGGKGKNRKSRQAETLLIAFVVFIAVMIGVERSSY